MRPFFTAGLSHSLLRPSPLALAPSPIILPATRGIKTIQLQVLIEAATPPPPTGLSYIWHLVRKLLGLDKEIGFEDLLSPVPGTEGAEKQQSRRSLLQIIKSQIWKVWYWRREAAPLPCGRWEDIHFWYGST